MPTSIKQLKVINNQALADDGTFSIGLRDNLVIKPKSQVGLSKFLYEEAFPSSLINLEKTSFSLTTELLPTFLSQATPSRTINIPKQLGINVYDLLQLMNYQASSVLICGDKTGSTTFTNYVNQKPNLPLNDAGLDIVFSLADNNDVLFSFTSGKPLMCLSEDTPNLNLKISMTAKVSGTSRFDIGAFANSTEYWWGYGDDNELIKGAVQCYIQVDEIGVVGQDWSWGLRYFDDDFYTNATPPRVGIYKGINNQFYLVDRGIIKDTPINYTWESGDFFILFSAKGTLTLQIFAGDPEGDGIEPGAVGDLKYVSPDFVLYQEVLPDPSVEWRMVIAAGEEYVETEIGVLLPSFRQIYSTWRATEQGVPVGLGRKRVIEMDFNGAGQLAQQFGLNETKYTSAQFQTFTLFQGTATPNFYRVQDISLFWSLPAHTYVGSQDKTRNSRENLVASFTPSRQSTSTSNLFFQEQIAYTDIGNLDTMNISTLGFRLVNEYPNFGTKVNTTYLAFTLFIKEEW